MIRNKQVLFNGVIQMILFVILISNILAVQKSQDQETIQYSSEFQMRSLEIKSEDKEEDGILQFLHSGKNNKMCILQNAEENQLQITSKENNEQEKILMSVDQNNVNFNCDTSKFNSLRYEKDFIINNVKQWKLVLQEKYIKPPTGWSQNEISFCGGINMLGGYGKLAGGEIQKEFIEIPEHYKIRIKANYHFIDAWSGETGFMRVNLGKKQSMEYVWTYKYDFSKSIDSINVCGAHYGEGQFTQHIDVSFSHISDSIIIGFGSTLDDDTLENSFGISNLEIYIM